MNANFLGDIADVIAIIVAATGGFRWLNKKLIGWARLELKNEVKKEVQEVVREELGIIDRRISMLEMWQRGFAAGQNLQNVVYPEKE